MNAEQLSGIANQLRIHSVAATTAAGSGHPTSCCSAADLVAALFFGHMRYHPKNPRHANNELPRSGKPEELMARYGIDAAAITNKVKSLAA